MAEPTFPTENRPLPDDQIRVPMPPLHGDPYACESHDEDAETSWRTHVLRVRGLSGEHTDLVPDAGASPSAAPADLFPGFDHAHVVAGVHGFGRPTTARDDRESLAALHDVLDAQACPWTPCVTSAPTRAWIEPGALLFGAADDDVLALARRVGQSRILRWDDAGLTPVDVSPDGLADAGDPVPVVARPAPTGCPMRCGADGWCKRVGGPWVRASISAAAFWEAHRQLLVGAFGCDVCHGGPVAQGGPTAMVDLFTPTRERGWQRGGPRPVTEA